MNRGSIKSNVISTMIENAGSPRLINEQISQQQQTSPQVNQQISLNGGSGGGFGVLPSGTGGTRMQNMINTQSGSNRSPVGGGNLFPPIVGSRPSRDTNNNINSEQLHNTNIRNTNEIGCAATQGASGQNISNPGQGNVSEQLSVNLTITKVGNGMFSSKIDISKHMVPDEVDDSLAGGNSRDYDGFFEHNNRGGPGDSLKFPLSSINDEGGVTPIVEVHEVDDNSANGGVSWAVNNEAQLLENNQTPSNNNQLLCVNDQHNNLLAIRQPQDILRTTHSRQLDMTDAERAIERFKNYDPRSLFIFSIKWKVRQLIIRLVRWKYFDYFMIASIAGNSILLSVIDYTDDENTTKWNQLLDKIDKGFTAVFICEAILKILAFGFILHKRSYMRDPWNVLDFIVVIIGLISLIPSVPNLKSLRTMRVLRPLRSINAVPSMKRLVATLLMALPRMGYLVSFLLFFIFIFAILGMQIFARDLYHRCRLDNEPYFNDNNILVWPFDPSQTRLCGGMYQCLPKTYCHALIERGLPLEQDMVWTWDFISYGYLHFDNIGVACLSVFRVITLEGWTSVMYNYLDSSGAISGFFFPILIVIGSFFLLNLFLAVIMETFSEVSQLQREKEESSNRKKVNELHDDGLPDSGVVKLIQLNRDRVQQENGVKNLSDATVMFLEMKHRLAIMKKEEEEKEAAEAVLALRGQSNHSSNGKNNSDHHYSQVMSPKSVKSRRSQSFKSHNNDQQQQNQAINQQIEQLNVQEISPDTKTHGALGGFTDEVNFQKENKNADFTPIGNEEDNSVTVFKSRGKYPFLDYLQDILLSICDSKVFQLIINLSIIVNTLCLGLDTYPINFELQARLDIVNIFFFTLFFLEMVIKITGMGPNSYIKDNYNIFDALIVSLSIVDVTLSYSMPSDDENSGKGAISAFRAFRLIRVFKLAKSWTKLQKLINTIIKSLVDISSFSVLLFLLILIYMLLGMEIFAEKINQVRKEGDPKVPRNNFNTFFNAFLVVFSVLTGENWDQTMFQFARQQGFVAIVFFVSLIIVGVMIFLNLFLAILLENFDDDDEEEQVNDDQSINVSQTFKISSMILTPWQMIKDYFHKLTQYIGRNKQLKTIEISELGYNRELKINLPSGQDMQEYSDRKGYHDHNSNQILSQYDKDMFQVNNPQPLEDTINLNDALPTLGLLPAINIQKRISNLEAIMEIDEDRTPKLRLASQFNVASNRRNDGAQLQSTMFRDRIGQISRDQSTVIGGKAFGLMTSGAQLHIGENFSDAMGHDSYHKNQRHDLNFIGSIKSLESANSPRQSFGFGQSVVKQEGPFGHESQLQQEQMTPHDHLLERPLQRLRTQIYNKNPPPFNKQVSFRLSQGPAAQGPLSNHSTVKRPPYLPRTFALIMQERARHMYGTHSILAHTMSCDGASLFILDNQNCFRLFIARIVKSKIFEGLILCLIGISSILLALDNPLNDPQSKLVSFLYSADIVLSTFFTAEAVFKVVTYGFLFNGHNSYLRNGWNFMDFIVVIFSIVSLSVTTINLKFVKILRLLRVLRPLRVISRNKGLKVGLQALFRAIPSIFNVIIILLLFFIIFAIIGVNYFKGTFYSCTFGDAFPQNYDFFVGHQVITKLDCYNWGGAWENSDFNFDNVPNAMSTLFQLSTTEGWLDIMNRGMDAVGIDTQPIQDVNKYWSLFFIFFIILGNFLMLNLFSGVIVSTFNKEKEILDKNYLLTENQLKWIEQKKVILNSEPKKVINLQITNRFRQGLNDFLHGKSFEIFILVCIVCNTVTLAINWYSQPVFVDDILDYINYFFAIIFGLESILKIIALGPHIYFIDKGNLFDFMIVITSIVSSIVSIVMDVDFGASTTFIRALRISRVFKFIRMAKQVKVMFETLVVTFPSLTNIGGLLLLFLYIFSVLGVFLFSEVRLQSNLNMYANFQSFGLAFLTLLRCCTGESWNYIMNDIARSRSITYQCDENDFDYGNYVANGFQTNGCGSIAGTIFFMSFLLMVPLIFLNLFIAIILEGFEQSNNREASLVTAEDLQHFIDVWALFDTNSSGFIKIVEFPEFMSQLGDPLGWDPKRFRDNQDLQDDYMEDLFIPTYNNFRDFLFWDVAMSLIKIYTVKTTLKANGAEFTSSIYSDEDDIYKSYHSENEDNPENQEEQDEKAKQKKIDDVQSQRTEASKQIDFDNYYHANKKELRLKFRLELEFEVIDNDLQQVLDVEEMQKKETRVKKSHTPKMDFQLSSAHIKAARKILAVWRRLKAKKMKPATDAGQKNYEQSLMESSVALISQASSRKGTRRKKQPNRNSSGQHLSVTPSVRQASNWSSKEHPAENQSGNPLLDISQLTAGGAGFGPSTLGAPAKIVSSRLEESKHSHSYQRHLFNGSNNARDYDDPLDNESAFMEEEKSRVLKYDGADYNTNDMPSNFQSQHQNYLNQSVISQTMPFRRPQLPVSAPQVDGAFESRLDMTQNPQWGLQTALEYNNNSSTMQEPNVDAAACRGIESSQYKLNQKLRISGLDDYCSDLV